MCDDFKTLLISYLREENIHNEEDVWEIVESEKLGRCLIAKRDLQPNEIIFKDKALFYGPRDNVYKEVFIKFYIQEVETLENKFWKIFKKFVKFKLILRDFGELRDIFGI